MLLKSLHNSYGAIAKPSLDVNLTQRRTFQNLFSKFQAFPLAEMEGGGESVSGR